MYLPFSPLFSPNYVIMHLQPLYYYLKLPPNGLPLLPPQSASLGYAYPRYFGAPDLTLLSFFLVSHFTFLLLHYLIICFIYLSY